MTDAFALLAEPRRPWLDAEDLKTRVLPQLTATHPDRVHEGTEEAKLAANTRHAELNAAYHTLRETRDRLLHLYELEAGAKPKDIQRIPPGTMDLFVEVGQLCRDADAFLQKKSGVTAPMLKLQLMQEGLNWWEKFQALQQRINAKRDELAGELQQLNGLWENAPPIGSTARPMALPLERLEQIYRATSYVARWTEQIQERLVQLTM